MATPKIIPYTVKLRSVVPEKTFSKPPVVFTNDLRSAEFQFKITDMDASELLTATAKTMLYMRDGSFFQNPSTDVSRVGNVFSYLLKENEGNHAGIAKIQLVVYFNEGLANEQNFPTQLYEFEIINGLETKVAPEVMIYDWTTLTRDARAYIDQFVADELLRDAEFDNNEFDRNTAFVASQESRTLAFGTEQTNRGTAFTAEQNERTTAFNESESGRTTAETGRVTAEDGRVIDENNRVTKEGQRVTAENNRVTAEGNRVTAETGRVTAENARVTAETNRAAAFTAFDTRLTAEETATAANKISAVKSKTFADVDARFEDVEFDTAMMGTNLVTNGDFSNGTTGWLVVNGTIVVANGIGELTTTTSPSQIRSLVSVTKNNIYYWSSLVKADSSLVSLELAQNVSPFTIYGSKSHSGNNTYERLSIVSKVTDDVSEIRARIMDRRTNFSTVVYIDNSIVIDLTAAFGKGNEPTAEQMDGIMAKFSNSWFNGTANLFRANATLNKLMAVDARTEFEENNLVSSGNVERIDTALAIWGGYKYYINAVNGNKYYVALEIKSDTPNAVRLQWSNSAVIGVLAEVNTYKRLSGIITNDKPTGQTYVSATDTRSSGWTPTYTKNATVIDLTAAFGAGKEPTLAEMDRLMARFPNSWFDGVKPIQTIETLYQEKANKTQEAWITPTLLNGWVTAETGTDAMYMKDEFGFVHLKGKIKSGTVGANALSLATGYKSINSKVFPVVSNGGIVPIVISNVVYINSTASNVYVSLDGIIFKAEA